ncbi:MAG TPA: hypothetical protein VFX70_07020 [Mycobacteriales bacterium]|nr:hypothetical protein [Mycobacteriales bacterium]
MKNMDHGRSLLLFGSGVLGGNVLDLLSWSGFSGEITVAGRNEATLRQRTNLTRIASYNQGRYPRLATRLVDLNDVDQTARVIADVRPDIILNTATVQTYWRISMLPEPTFRALAEAGLGAWLAMHLSPAHRLMTAVRRSGHTAVVVNAAYPDAVNPALHTRSLAPSIGVGNVMNAVPAIRASAALLLDAPVRELQIKLVAHHYVGNRLPAAGDTGGAPFHLRIYQNGSDVTEMVDVAEMFRLLPTELVRTRGSAGMYVTASSVVAVIDALLSPTPVALHAPGPAGLVGGYPVLVSSNGISLDLPETCSPETAIAVNEGGQVFDGIDRISDSGRVTLTPKAVEIMKRTLGHDCPEFNVDECHGVAAELRSRYLAFEARSSHTVSPR